MSGILKMISEKLTELLIKDRLGNENKEFFRTLFEDHSSAMLIIDAYTGIIIDANNAAVAFYGWTIDELKQMNIKEINALPKEIVESNLEKYRSGKQFSLHFSHRHADGSTSPVEILSNTIESNGRVLYYSIITDITERLRNEDAMRHSEERFRLLFENHSAVMILLDPETGTIVKANHAAATFYGWSIDELQTMNIQQITNVTLEEAKANMAKAKNLTQNEFIFRHQRADGSVRDVEIFSSPIEVDGKRILYVIIHDITERKLAENKLFLQLQHMRALREVDHAIRGTTDIYLSLKSILEYTLSELQVDAADIFLFNRNTSTLRHAVGRGFLETAVSRAEIKLGLAYIDKLLFEGEIVHIKNLSESRDELINAALVKNEGFVEYYAIPLIVKNKIVGLFEIFHRKPLPIAAEWLDFLHTLASQAAIVIEDHNLFRKLYHSNQELLEAYDETIAGWSRALDIRDRETEGHSQRVTDLTMKLAQLVGIKEEEIIHVRRGALLHDIGKMGVPDSILLKQDSLTDSEWGIMRQHPGEAYSLLAPIAYLRPALDIPYCHHEKWDGTGYPRGLKGEEIPLSARLFAIVDVWDSLRSGRCYRKKWKEEKVIEHIKSLSGTHFDPKIVEKFLTLLVSSQLSNTEQ